MTDWVADPEKAIVTAWAGYGINGGFTIGNNTVLPTDGGYSDGVTRLDIVTRNGKKMFMLKTRAADVDPFSSSASRSELGQGNPSRDFGDGTGDRLWRANEHIYVGWTMEIPSAVKPGNVPLYGGANGFFTIMQNKGAGSGYPAGGCNYTRLSTNGPGEIAVDVAQTSSLSSPYYTVWHTVPVLDREFRILLHLFINSDPTKGFVEVWSNADGGAYRKVAGPFFGSTQHATTQHMRIGPYRGRQAALNTDTTLYYGRVASTSTLAKTEAALGWTDGGGEPPPATPINVDLAADRETLFQAAASHLTDTAAAIAITAYPNYTIGSTGSWVTGDSALWTSGFLPGLFWKLYHKTGDVSWRDKAISWQTAVDAQKTNATLHDIGLMFLASFVQGYEIAGTLAYKTSSLTAATTLSGRYDAGAKIIKSFEAGVHNLPTLNTIIDSMMAVELLFWAARNGAADASTLYSRALEHCRQIRLAHVRANGSSYQTTTYDAAGVVLTHPVIQGYATESTWSRGQAWGIHGFTAAYRETLAANPADAANFLATAKLMATWFLDNLPADGIPRWDFNAPATDLQKDSSAAAIAAAGMLELHKYDSSRDWRAAARDMLNKLGSTDYQATTTESRAILKHGVSAKPQNIGVDVGTIYGDFYFVEALERYAALPTVDTNRSLALLNEPGSGVEFPLAERLGSVTVADGQFRFALSATVARSRARTAQNLLGLDSTAVIVGPITWPAWVSGTGEVAQYVAIDFGSSNNRMVIQRRRTFAGTAVATKDQIESRLVINNSDPAPVPTEWTQVTGAIYLKIALVDQTVSYQISTDGSSFTPVATRPFPAEFDFNLPVYIEVGQARLGSGDVVAGTFAVGPHATHIVYGTTAADPGIPITKSDTALNLDGTVIRVFPALSGIPGSLLVVCKPTNASKLMVPLSQAKMAGITVLDNFNRADGTLGANYAVIGGNTMPLIVSNQANSGTSGKVDAVRTDQTFTDDHFVFAKLAVKPAAPGTKLFSWLGLFARMSGSVSTANGYELAIAYNTNGSTSWYFAKITNGSFGPGFHTLTLVDVPLAVGDLYGFRVVGSTLEGWRKPSGGVWTLVGSTTDTTFTTGGRIGMGLDNVGVNATAADDLFAGPVLSTLEPFPSSHSGRSMRITTGRQPQYYNNMLTPPSGFGGGTMPATPAWSAVAVERASSDGSVSTRIWNPATLAFEETNNIAVLGAGATITDSGARLVLGDREPTAVTEMSYVGAIAAFAVWTEALGAVGFESLINNGVLSVEALLDSNPLRAYDLTTLAAPGDQILDIVGTAHEVTGERVGTGTIVTDTGNVPVGAGTGGTTPPTTPSVPDPVGFAVTNAIVDPAAPTTGKLHLHVNAPVADAGINFTPHATPIGFFYSTTPDGALVQQGSWQSSTELDVTGLVLSTEDAVVTRWWTAKYRNNAGTPLVGDEATPRVPITIIDTTQPDIVIGTWVVGVG